MKTVDRIDEFQRKHAVLGYPIGVLYKFFDDQGAYLAALITYYGFLSIFPLMLLLSSALGFLVQSNGSLREEVVKSALSQIPVIGQELQAPRGLQGSLRAVITGSVIALYGGLGIAQAIQNMSNACWGVPRNARPNPILARVRSAFVLLIMGVALIGVGWLPNVWHPLGGSWQYVLNLILGVGVFLLLMRMTTAKSRPWQQLLPGAILVSVVWQVFTIATPAFIKKFLAHSSETYGTFGVVLSLLFAGYILALAIVFGTEMNVVAHHHLYPRSLMTPFTDNVHLTLADQQAYANLARAQRLKSYEYIDVAFDQNDDGVADWPSDIEHRYHDARRDHEKTVAYGHPRRPHSIESFDLPFEPPRGSTPASDRPAVSGRDATNSEVTDSGTTDSAAKDSYATNGEETEANGVRWAGRYKRNADSKRPNRGGIDSNEEATGFTDS